MKKNNLLLAALLALPLLVACTQTTYKPSRSYPGDPLIDDNQGEGEGEGGEGEGDGIDRSEFNLTINFYLDYSHSDEPLYSMRWYMLTPLGQEEYDKLPADVKNPTAADPLYPVFLGYSEYPSSIDDSKIWNFVSDYKQSYALNLYGIWVSEQEVKRI